MYLSHALFAKNIKCRVIFLLYSGMRHFVATFMVLNYSNIDYGPLRSILIALPIKVGNSVMNVPVP